MKCLKRNKIRFYYALCTGESAVQSENYFPGDTVVSYGAPVEVEGNIAPPSGNVFVELYGNNIQYDRVIVLDDPNTPIDETTVLCIDKEPSYDGSGQLIFDYIVRRVARSLNSVSIAVSRVNVS